MSSKGKFHDAARLFSDASGFDDRIASVDDIARMEARLPAATADLRQMLCATDGRPCELPTTLLEQALRVSYLDGQRAALILTNLVAFRAEQGWPLRLGAASCELPLRSRAHYILPDMDAHGRAVLVFNAGLVDVRLCPVKEFHRMASYVMEQLTADPAVQHRGIALLLNLEGTELGMARHFGYADIRRGVAMYKDAFPCKVKVVMVVNASAVVRRLLGFVLALVHPRVRARVELVPSIGALRDTIPAGALTTELGGELESERLWAEWCDARLRLERTPHELPRPHAGRPGAAHSPDAAVGAALAAPPSSSRPWWSRWLRRGDSRGG